MEKGAVIETGTGVKIVAIEMWMWTVKEIEETGIGTETGRGTVSVIAAVIGKGEVLLSFADFCVCFADYCFSPRWC